MERKFIYWTQKNPSGPIIAGQNRSLLDYDRAGDFEAESVNDAYDYAEANISTPQLGDLLFDFENNLLYSVDVETFREVNYFWRKLSDVEIEYRSEQ